MFLLQPQAISSFSILRPRDSGLSILFLLCVRLLYFIYLYVNEFYDFCMLVHLCCDLYRSPSWPVWAPRIPNSSQNSSAQPFTCRLNTCIETPSSPPSSLLYMNPRTRFWSTSSPVSSRNRATEAQDPTMIGIGITTENVRPTKEQQKEPLCIRNGLLNDTSRPTDCRNDGNCDIPVTPGSFKTPGLHDISRHTRKNYERNNFETLNERNAMMSVIAKKTNDSQSNVFAPPIAKPRINHAGWRGMSKTCDCIEKGKTSPVLRLIDQARAVSSPDPLHRPDNQRASLRSATTAQTLR